MKKSLLIYGAGAIGRGFVPWIFDPNEYNFYYVEKNLEIKERLNKHRKFISYRINQNTYEEKEVKISECFSPGEEKEILNRISAVITAVGPRNITSLQEVLMNSNMPVICCENDSSIPETLGSIIKNPHVVFAIPDVITSNTAPHELLEKDPNCIVTENGVCYIDDSVSSLGGEAKYVSKKELQSQWLAKLYIHNTPHCIAAYLGSITGVTYLHESMQNESIKKIVSGAMYEMVQMLLKKYSMDEKFVNWYSRKELKRFENKLLYDPIYRVAREPFRKLTPNERLLGAAQLCLSQGIIPENIVLGIMSAFAYDNKMDPDANITYLINSISPEDFLKIIIGLNPAEALYEMLLSSWNENIKKIEILKNE